MSIPPRDITLMHERDIAAGIRLSITTEGFRQLQAAFDDPTHAIFTRKAFASLPAGGVTDFGYEAFASDHDEVEHGNRKNTPSCSKVDVLLTSAQRYLFVPSTRNLLPRLSVHASSLNLPKHAERIQRASKLMMILAHQLSKNSRSRPWSRMRSWTRSRQIHKIKRFRHAMCC
jgi:hypothetical protein